MGEYQQGGKGNEPFYMSRRVWGALLSLLAIIGLVTLPEYYELLSAIFVGGAGLLGLTSWTMPKK